MHQSFCTPPSEESLGVPVPLGSVYSAELSAFYSGYSERYSIRYAFELAGDFAATVQFFEQATRNEAVSSPLHPLVAEVPIGPVGLPGGGAHAACGNYVMVKGSADSRSVRIVVCKGRCYRPKGRLGGRTGRDGQPECPPVGWGA